MEFKTTFKFYAVENAPYIGAYRTGSFNDGEPQIMFAMDFHTWAIKDVPKAELTEAFKDGMLQTITHEFCHAMQEMLDKDYDELEVERILGAYKPTWNALDNPEQELPESLFSIYEFLAWLDVNKSKTVEDLKADINKIFEAHRLYMKAQEQLKQENQTPSPKEGE